MATTSWEFYTQVETGGGVSYPLWFTAGLANSGGNGGLFETMPLMPNTLYAVPFDVLRPQTVSKLILSLVSQDSNVGAACRLGIYNNAASNNNVPSTLVIDAGLITIDKTASSTLPTLAIAQPLVADVRYWAVLFTNGSVSNATIGALPQGSSIPFGVFQNPMAGSGNGLAIARHIIVPGQTFGALPAGFPAVNLNNLIWASSFQVPAISMAFSVVV